LKPSACAGGRCFVIAEVESGQRRSVAPISLSARALRDAENQGRDDHDKDDVEKIFRQKCQFGQVLRKAQPDHRRVGNMKDDCKNQGGRDADEKKDPKNAPRMLAMAPSPSQTFSPREVFGEAAKTTREARALPRARKLAARADCLKTMDLSRRSGLWTRASIC
jgi:hypothetical protein